MIDWIEKYANSSKNLEVNLNNIEPQDSSSLAQILVSSKVPFSINNKNIIKIFKSKINDKFFYSKLRSR